MPWIENVAATDVSTKFHYDAGVASIVSLT